MDGALARVNTLDRVSCDLDSSHTLMHSWHEGSIVELRYGTAREYVSLQRCNRLFKICQANWRLIMLVQRLIVKKSRRHRNLRKHVLNNIGIWAISSSSKQKTRKEDGESPSSYIG